MGISLNKSHKQHGSMLLEALISILIFSMGILAIVGLQAGSVSMSSDAQYRSEASIQASRYINSMWGDVAQAVTAQVTPAGAAAAGVPAGTPVKFDVNEFDSFRTGGANFNVWLGELQLALPNANADVKTATIISCKNKVCPPVFSSPSLQDTRTVATIVINWSVPGCGDPVAKPSCLHSYTTQAIISAQKIVKG